MRTTLTIDDDLVGKIEELRRAKGLSFKGAVNYLLRAGIQFQAQPPKPTSFRTRPARLGLRSGIDPTKLNQLLDDLDADDFTSAEGR